jgi:GGDEF domain-containing protein
MILKRRDKLVYFRISGEEFGEILRACDAKGARSVSDLARAAVQEFIKGSGNQPEQQMVEFMKELQTMMDELRQSVQQLVSAVAAPGLTVASDRNFRDGVDHKGAESEPDISA